MVVWDNHVFASQMKLNWFHYFHCKKNHLHLIIPLRERGKREGERGREGKWSKRHRQIGNLELIMESEVGDLNLWSTLITTFKQQICLLIRQNEKEKKRSVGNSSSNMNIMSLVCSMDKNEMFHSLLALMPTIEAFEANMAHDINVWNNQCAEYLKDSYFEKVRFARISFKEWISNFFPLRGDLSSHDVF